MRIRIRHNVRQLQRFLLDQAPKQLRFAAALGLTRTAKDAEAAVYVHMRGAFDRPTPYTMRALRVVPATKAKLEASLLVKGYEDAPGGVPPDNFLYPQVEGGERRFKAFERALQRIGVLGRREVAVPATGARFDAYGNMSRGQIVQVMSYLQAFGEQGYMANATARSMARIARGNRRTGQRGLVYFVSRGKGNSYGYRGSWMHGEKRQHLPRGVWARYSFGPMGSAIKPVLLFYRMPTYRKRMDFYGVAERIVDARLVANIDKAMVQALATARTDDVRLV